jgi:ribosomal protein S18 acetylase RimI-like enzyme
LATPHAVLRPASAFSAAELADAFTAGYEGYDLPIQLDAAAFSAMADLSDFDLELSRVTVVGDRPAGICMLGVRRDRCWIGGLGVVPSERRKGHAARLTIAVLAHAQEAGLRRASLEVLEANAGAIALYERLGFERTRMLEVWSLPAGATETGAEPATVESALEWIGENRTSAEPWQRADESVGNLLAGGAELEAVRVPGRGAAVLRAAGEVASMLQLAARDDEAARLLLSNVRTPGRSVRFLNVPEGDPASRALRELGGELAVRQLELALRLDR